MKDPIVGGTFIVVALIFMCTCIRACTFMDTVERLGVDVRRSY